MKKILSISSVCLLAFLSGCSDDGVQAPASTTTLTQAQAEALAEEIGSGLGGIAGLNKLNARFQSVTEAITFTENCPGGGTISVSGNSSGSASGNGGSATFSTTETYSSCVINVENSQPMTVNGSLTHSGSFSGSAQSQDSFNLNFNTGLVGTLAVTGDGVTAGNCGIGVAFTGTFNQDGYNFNASGSICTVEVNKTLTATF